jgi:hypothetical protein
LGARFFVTDGFLGLSAADCNVKSLRRLEREILYGCSPDQGKPLIVSWADYSNEGRRYAKNIWLALVFPNLDSMSAWLKTAAPQRC